MFYSACGKRVVPLGYRKRKTSVTNYLYCETVTDRYCYVVTLERVTTCGFSLNMQSLFLYFTQNVIVMIFLIETFIIMCI